MNCPLENIEVTSSNDDAKFLGVKWKQTSDELGVFTDKALKELLAPNPSKRTLLKGLACIYDVIGILAPTTVKAKTIFQSLWRQRMDWDTPLPENIKVEYDNFVEQLQRNSSITVDRCLMSQRTKGRHEIHTFTDASMEAYGCVTYLRTVFPVFVVPRRPG